MAFFLCFLRLNQTDGGTREKMSNARLQTKAFGLALFLWMAVIFAFSSLHGSSFPTDPPIWYFLERKGAHVFEYALLMLLSFCFFNRFFLKESFWKYLLISGAFSLMYAVTDELHQLFVPYRGAKITDVAIDGLGIFLMSLFLVILWKRSKK